jgi:hypothetical protein
MSSPIKHFFKKMLRTKILVALRFSVPLSASAGSSSPGA